MSSSISRSQVAERFAAFGTTIFTEISKRAVELDAINLGQGFPNFDGPDAIKQAAFDAMQAGHNQYAPMPGIAPLRQTLAERYLADTGRAVDPDTEVTVTTGCTEAIASGFLGLVNPGEEVILFEPYYDSYRAAAAMAGAKPKYVTLHPPDFAVDENALREAFTDNTRAIMVNTPHNPTGKVFTRDELTLIAKLCQNHDAIAFSDEVYEYLVFDREHIRLATLDGMYERTITMSSLGKTFSLTGWKVGWAIAPPELTAGLRSAKQFTTFCTAAPLQHAAVTALNLPESYYRDFVLAYKQRRDLLADGLSRIGFEVHMPHGGYFTLADHTAFGFDDDVSFCRHLIENIGVAAIPPSAFYQVSDEGKKMTRFAFCKDEETLREALHRLNHLQ